MVKIAAALFFDVAPQLEADDWVLCAVIAREEHEGNTDLATHLRLAFFGGPLVAQTIVDAPERLPAVEVERLRNQSLMLYAKAMKALAVPLRGSKSVLAYLKMYMDWRCKSQKIELAREKFRHRCEQELRRAPTTEPPAETTTEEPTTPAAMPKVA